MFLMWFYKCGFMRILDVFRDKNKTECSLLFFLTSGKYLNIFHSLNNIFYRLTLVLRTYFVTQRTHLGVRGPPAQKAIFLARIDN